MPKAAKYRVRWQAGHGGYEVGEPPREQLLPLAPGEREWFTWLETVPSFTFHGQDGQLTMRKESRPRGEGYWYAYRRVGQKMVKKYVGRTAELTLARLEEVATLLARAEPSPLKAVPAAARGQSVPQARGEDKSDAAVGSKLTPAPSVKRGVPGDASPIAAQPAPPGLAPPSPFPRPLTRLLGREYERAQVVALLRRPEVRLLTLTGPGGVGKTRLALSAAQDLAPDFAGGVYFVSLSAISEPDFVLPALAQTLGLRELDTRSTLEVLQAALADRSLLLLLDNFEQVLPAAPPLADLLAACPQVKLLVTSRAALRLSGEHELATFPLALPDLAQVPTPEALLQSGACALFVERVQAIQPDFAVTQANTHAIAEICRRLDGLPLAIELAAARARLLSPHALLSRLSHRLDVLTGGERNAPARQQTMRATIAWSYQLLAPEQQRLFRWLAVFVGGCTISAAEAIAQPAGVAPSSILDGASVLLENHLLRKLEQPDGEPRLLTLETIREYGLECLEECGELEAARTAHATYFLTLAEEAEPQLRGAEQTRWLAQLEQEQENLRAALSFLFEQARLQAGAEESQKQAERAQRFCVALSWFWSTRGYGREGLRFLEQALSYRADVGAELRARVLSAAATLPLVYTRHRQLERLVEESLTVYQELGDPVGIATSLLHLGSIARITSQFALARERLEDAAARFQKLGQSWNQGQCFTELARAATGQGQYEQARVRLEESLVLYQTLGDTQRIGWVRYLQARLFFLWQQDLPGAQQLAEQSLALFGQQDDTLYSILSLGLIGLIRLEQGELLAARSLLEDSVATGKQRGIETDITEMCLGLARLLAWQGEADAARRLYQESLTLLLACNVYKEHVAASLEGLAALEARQGALYQAARLWGAAHAQREAIGAPLYPVERANYEQARELARAQLGEQAFRAAWAEGRLMTPEQALAAQEQATPPTALPTRAAAAPPLHAPTLPFGLTAREVEVLHLLAQGLSDAQIAEHMVISVRTVNRHTTSLYSKLAVSSRAAATRAALEHHLL